MSARNRSKGHESQPANQSPGEGFDDPGTLAAFGDVISYTHDAVMLLAMDGTILSWNPSAERQYGWRREDVLGKNAHELLRTHFPIPKDKIKAQLEKTGHWEGELVHACRDGIPLTVESRWVLRKNLARPANIVLEVNTDVAERKRLERRLRRIYDSDMIGVAFLTIDGVLSGLTAANDYFLNLTGYTREDLNEGNVSWADISPIEYREAESRAIKEMRATGAPPPRLEYELVRKDGSRVPVMIRLAPVEGAPREAILCAVDMSEYHEMREQLKREHEAVRVLSTPVLQVRPHLLIVPMVGVIDEGRAQQLTTQLLESIRQNRARIVVLDVTGVPNIDANVANRLVQTVTAARLLGTEVIVTGISRQIAHTLVTLAADFSQLRVVGDLQNGIEEAEAILRRVA